KNLNFPFTPIRPGNKFVKEATPALVEPPQYFPKNAMMNKMGYDSIEDVRRRGLQALNVREFKTAWEAEDALVIDTRPQEKFAKGFIPGSVFIGVDGSFAMWVGALIQDLKTPILFVAEPGREDEVVTRLSRVGYDNPIGYLEGGFEAWTAAGGDVDTINEVDATQLAQHFDGKNLSMMDVRKASEYNAEHLVGAFNFPLDFINRNMSAIDRNKTYYIYCASGYRSVVAASILKTRGFEQVVNVRGGYKALIETPLKRTEFVEQLTEL
nr:rhodanese-like domain-containing protein [Flavilitoribacter sp.]